VPDLQSAQPAERCVTGAVMSRSYLESDGRQIVHAAILI
jgi:hypothetical protein